MANELQRRILLSATWQQDSELSPAAAEKDPENRLYGRMSRLREEPCSVAGQALAPRTNILRKICARRQVPRGLARTVGAATDGSSGQGCRGYCPRMSRHTSAYDVFQKPARSVVTCNGCPPGDSSVILTGCAATVGCRVTPNNSCNRTANAGVAPS